MVETGGEAIQPVLFQSLTPDMMGAFTPLSGGGGEYKILGRDVEGSDGKAGQVFYVHACMMNALLAI